ncbi:hypothetical protein BLA60_40530 [Actinophytocola xinjiangensis]|uniref:Uncharacterized protein n=1 Tax=Actinophytocola xinjiangensis TaxID=485602 RepID=A0A7Z0WDE5_9PSEU|nr:hypothetical protein [Actinophytocola xinjiangensis]OLF04475.1 hypothetical protein BLA60_40530 [Actinophytocola xinjiangensis]
MTQTHVPVIVAGVVALAFLLLVGLLVWRLTATTPGRAGRILVSVAAVLAGLPAVLYALLNEQA